MNFIQKLISKFQTAPLKNPEPGQKWSDKEWGDTIIEIIKLNKDETEVRYRFLQIRGKGVNFPSIYDTKTYLVKEQYTLL